MCTYCLPRASWSIACVTAHTKWLEGWKGGEHAIPRKLSSSVENTHTIHTTTHGNTKLTAEYKIFLYHLTSTLTPQKVDTRGGEVQKYAVIGQGTVQFYPLPGTQIVSERFPMGGTDAAGTGMAQVDPRWETMLNRPLPNPGMLFQQPSSPPRLSLDDSICGTHHRHECVEEARLAAEDLLSVSHRPAQDATKHVAATVVGRAGAVRDGDGQGADVVGHNSIRHVNVVGVLFANLF